MVNPIMAVVSGFTVRGPNKDGGFTVSMELGEEELSKEAVSAIIKLRSDKIYRITIQESQ